MHITDRSNVIGLPPTEPMLLHVPIPLRLCLAVVSSIPLVRHHLRSTLFHLCCHAGESQHGDLARHGTYTVQNKSLIVTFEVLHIRSRIFQTWIQENLNIN